MNLIELRGITKTFPGTRALDRVNLEVRSGEVVALLGENGAGKSTLMKILSGVWPTGSYDGQVLGSEPERVPLQLKDTRDAHAAGIAMIHQELSVFPELTVAEHLELDQLPGWIQWDELFSRTQKFLDQLDLGLRADTRVAELSVGGQQLVEIARALYRDAKILVFDEPTSALTEPEVVRLYSIIERLRSEGRGIVYITHRLDEVFKLADRMVVLRDGQVVGEFTGGNFDRNKIEPQLISMMVGRAIEDIFPERNRQFGNELLRVKCLSVRSPQGKLLVQNVDFIVHEGEVVGLAGLLGAGRSEIFRAIFGAFHPLGPQGPGYQVQGHVWVRGEPVSLGVPKDSLGLRLAFVSEDRKGDGLVLDQPIRANMMLPALSKSSGFFSWIKGISQDWENTEALRWGRELQVKAASYDQPVGELSGGNQQKVVLAKWLMTEPEVLFLDEPTRGIDVGAKAEIYQWIRKLAGQGLGVVVASSEMPELLGLCNRIIVLREGQVSAELPAESATQEQIMRAASL